tara:strand:+ start:23745 stop:24671 length:927 start_codon:yes stop_codon:yes gene_type:complete
MHYLVTGGAGFIGSHLVEALLASGNTVTIIDDLSSGSEDNLAAIQGAAFIDAKLQDYNLKKLEAIDGIFHLAAQVSVPLSIKDFKNSSINNIASSLNVLDHAKEKQTPVVYASSSAVYGNLPAGDDEQAQVHLKSPYAADKYCLEQYAKTCHELFQLPSMGMRFFNVYGPRQDPNNPYSGVISIFIKQFIEQRPITLFGGEQTRDFIFVKDIAKLLIKGMQRLHGKPCCEVTNIGTGHSISIQALAELLAKLFNTQLNAQYSPLPAGDPLHSTCISKHLTTLLEVTQKDFLPLKEGLRQTIEYITARA